MQVYTGEFFKEPSPDSETAVDGSYCGFGMSEQSQEMSGFGRPVKVQAGHLAHSDYWDIPFVKCVTVFLIIPYVSKHFPTKS